MSKPNLFAFGCSFTKDNYQQTWADLLAQDLDCNLHNFAERGAGADFLVRRLLTSKISSQDTVAIMWPSADRFDLWVDATVPHLVADLGHSSWPDGKQPKFVDFYGRYHLSHGFAINGSVPRGHKHKFYKFFYTAQQAVTDWWINIVTAQLFLERQGIRYVMMSAFPLTNPIHYHHSDFVLVPEIFNQINLNRFVDHSRTQGFYHFCVRRQLDFLDSHHPSTAAHEVYLNEIIKPKLHDTGLR